MYFPRFWGNVSDKVLNQSVWVLVGKSAASEVSSETHVDG